ncbi:acyl-CoA dehydrogenase family protein [Actinophytocola sp.]|uniref:acyl-CoA dehydrogenase family protein n=1 Tax=Actinophytocola sp. TaxID=1872138 RepID=UPI002ED49285
METEPQAWTKHQTMVTELGLCTITQDGGTLADQAAALTAAARHLIPGPLLPTALGSLLDLPHVTAVALDPGDLTVTGDRVTGTTSPVLGADGVVLLRAGDTWCTVQHPLTPLTPLDFSRPLGRLTLTDVPVTRLDLDTTTVTHLAATLFAAEAAGIARWCLDTAVAYAKIREQFDRPIGSFQAVKHLCAEMLCRSEQAAALAWDAARAPESLSAPAAAALALDAAVDNAKDCVQILGGIGFTWEHDAHLYLRRALANRQLLGGSARWRRRVADLALAGERRGLGVVADDEAARSAAREFAASLSGLSTAEQRSLLADSGYLVPHWPRPYGLAASAKAQLVIDDELTKAGVTRPDLVIGAWAAPTILSHGTEEQQKRFVPPTLRGELHWCQLFSEPGAGSDLASLRTKAVRVEGGWGLSGQKVWTSAAVEADWGICLARTNPDAPKHSGITYFLVDMKSPGITLRPLREITGEARFNEVFLDDVFVPDECVVGEVDGGWRLARTTLANERVALGGGSSLGDGVERLLSLVTDVDYWSRERLGFLVAQGLSVSLVDLRATLRQLDGRGPGPESSVCKLVGVRQRQDVAEAAVDLLGPAGAAVDETTEPVLHELLLTRCLSIAGGTTQVLRNLVGERILGLPREKP